jgi:hypothetical protein
MPADYPGQRNYIGQINRVGADNLVKEILAKEPHTSFHFVLGRMLEKLQEENRTIAFRDEATVPELAWAGRNIMELRVLSAYTCQSQENLDRFQSDILVSGTTMVKTMIRIHNDLARSVGAERVPEGLHRNQGELQDAREQAGLGGESPLMARTCAKRVGMEKEFLAFSGVTSALVHPSALSILKTFDLESCRQVLVLHSLKLAGDVIVGVRGHIEKYGCKPAR